jgi:hypothetical protein
MKMITTFYKIIEKLINTKFKKIIKKIEEEELYKRHINKTIIQFNTYMKNILYGEPYQTIYEYFSKTISLKINIFNF